MLLPRRKPADPGEVVRIHKGMLLTQAARAFHRQLVEAGRDARDPSPRVFVIEQPHGIAAGANAPKGAVRARGKRNKFGAGEHLLNLLDPVRYLLAEIVVKGE